MMELNRRSFFFGAGATVIAAAVPVNLKQVPVLYGDGVHDDTEALQAFFNHDRFKVARGNVLHRQNFLIGGRFLISETIKFGATKKITVKDCEFVCSDGFDGRYILQSMPVFDGVKVTLPSGTWVGRSHTPPPTFSPGVWIEPQPQ
ncbi:MAG: hypothetical protein GYB49_09575 [Alphaproteobacteria bacterium]|nr:hypothetical protein [Alphaproteobacteria bacterium]